MSNLYSTDLGVPIGDWRAAFEIALKGEVRQIDVGGDDAAGG